MSGCLCALHIDAASILRRSIRITGKPLHCWTYAKYTISALSCVLTRRHSLTDCCLWKSQGTVTACSHQRWGEVFLNSAEIRVDRSRRNGEYQVKKTKKKKRVKIHIIQQQVTNEWQELRKSVICLKKYLKSSLQFPDISYPAADRKTGLQGTNLRWCHYSIPWHCAINMYFT